MKVGYYSSEMIEIVAHSIEEAAKDYADEHHEIAEICDLEFELFVEDDEGVLHIVKMYTEYDPRYEVNSTVKQ